MYGVLATVIWSRLIKVRLEVTQHKNKISTKNPEIPGVFQTFFMQIPGFLGGIFKFQVYSRWIPGALTTMAYTKHFNSLLFQMMRNTKANLPLDISNEDL